jgi:AraC-like DNA-binding protein
VIELIEPDQASDTYVKIDPSLPLIDEPLAEALQYMRMDGMFYCLSELTAPWGVSLPPMEDCVWFHVVVSGSCILTDSTGTEHRLGQGDIAVLPRGSGHSAVDVIGSDAPLVFDLPHEYISRQYAILRHGGSGDRATVICGGVRLAHPAGRILIELLPEVLRVEGRDATVEWPWMPSLLGLMASETRYPQPGGEAVVTRLCDILIIQSIRHWINTSPQAQSGWIGALRDPDIGRAISLIHRNPERGWTVASLASELSMSRSKFSARFSELVGQSAMQYVTKWRMLLAEDLLRNEQLPIAQVARQLGYGSEAAFSRAFKRTTGQSPSRARTAVPALEQML